MAKPWRPSIDDVDSISRGGPAKVRGTGSRRIPHRLNAEERTLYDLAKKKSFLAVRGTAYRKFRHGNPLPNIYRQWCDARGHVCVVVEQDLGGSRGTDRVVVDLAPLRWEDTRRAEVLLGKLAEEAGLRRVSYEERPPDALPFNILPPDESEEEVEQEELAQARGHDGALHSVATGASGGGSGVAGAAGGAAVHSPERQGGSGDAVGGASSSGGAAAGPREPEEAVAALRREVEAQGEVVRQLKAQGLTNKDPAVQEQVQLLLKLKADLAQSQPSQTSPLSSSAASAASAAHDPQHQQQQQQPEAHGSHQEQSGRLHHHSNPTAAVASAATAVPPTDGLAAPRRSPLEHYYRLPIWQIHAVPLFFEGSRAAAKEFASGAVQAVVSMEAARQGPAVAAAATDGAPAHGGAEALVASA